MKGVFAAGDIRKGATNQLAFAAGEGTTAALMIRDYFKTALAKPSEAQSSGVGNWQERSSKHPFAQQR